MLRVRREESEGADPGRGVHPDLSKAAGVNSATWCQDFRTNCGNVALPVLRTKRYNAEQAYRRVARLGDGWMTTFKSPEDVQTSLAMIREYAREMGHELKPDFEVAIYHNINVDQDRDRAFAEAKRFLDSYYSVDYRQDMLKFWVAAGSPAQCVQSLQRYVDAGATTMPGGLSSDRFEGIFAHTPRGQPPAAERRKGSLAGAQSKRQPWSLQL